MNSVPNRGNSDVRNPSDDRTLQTQRGAAGTAGAIFFPGPQTVASASEDNKGQRPPRDREPKWDRRDPNAKNPVKTELDNDAREADCGDLPMRFTRAVMRNPRLT